MRKDAPWRTTGRPYNLLSFSSFSLLKKRGGQKWVRRKKTGEKAALWLKEKYRREIFPELRHNYSLCCPPPPLRTLRAALSVCCCCCPTAFVCVWEREEGTHGAVTSPTQSTHTHTGWEGNQQPAKRYVFFIDSDRIANLSFPKVNANSTPVSANKEKILARNKGCYKFISVCVVLEMEVGGVCSLKLKITFQSKFKLEAVTQYHLKATIVTI